MKSFNYEIKPFRVNIIVIFDKNVSNGLNYLIEKCDAKINYNPEDEKDTLGIVGHGLDAEGLNAWYIIFNEDLFTFGCLAHECFHAISRIAYNKGMLLTEASEEYYAYAIEDMFNYIKEKYNE